MLTWSEEVDGGRFIFEADNLKTLTKLFKICTQGWSNKNRQQKCAVFINHYHNEDKFTLMNFLRIELAITLRAIKDMFDAGLPLIIYRDNYSEAEGLQYRMLKVIKNPINMEIKESTHAS